MNIYKHELAGWYWIIVMLSLTVFMWRRNLCLVSIKHQGVCRIFEVFLEVWTKILWLNFPGFPYNYKIIKKLLNMCTRMRQIIIIMLSLTVFSWRRILCMVSIKHQRGCRNLWSLRGSLDWNLVTKFSWFSLQLYIVYDIQ